MNTSHHRALYILLLALLCVMPGQARSQEVGGDIAVTFDEAGDLIFTEFTSGALDVYVVGYGLIEISGYEFQLNPTLAPSFFLGKVLYGIAPLDSGVEYETRADTGGCVSSAQQMGASADSWTMVKYELGYFAGIPDDTLFCVASSTSSSASAPQYTLCDEEATKQDFHPAWDDPCGIAPSGCAIANVTICEIPTRASSWGTLKSQFGS